MRKLSLSKITLFVIAFFLVAPTSSLAQTFDGLLSFDGVNGNQPSYESLIQGTNGNFYGTTYLGGTNNGGTFFEITPTGEITTLYNFCSLSACTDGIYPYAGVVQASNGDFYGTTSNGGAYNGGTVFQITAAGVLTTLYSFCSLPDCNDGEVPSAALVQAANGNFYGTTQDGGANGGGTIFEITPAGVLTTLYSFCETTNCADGENPVAPLIQANNGNFYGTTYYGGGYRVGVAFELTKAGEFTTLRGFNRIHTGANPYAGLVQASNGNFYGVTSEGGANAGYADEGGTFFEITSGSVITALYSFCAQANCTDGSLPSGGLVLGTDGNFYGTAQAGGTNNGGTVFEMTPTGGISTLYNFCSLSNCSDGENPYSGLLQGTNGTFYGTAFAGGSNGDGSFFSLSTGLGPFIQIRPIAGEVSLKVDILGTNLTGTTAVTFNGTSAAFTNVSKTEVTANVPANATSGPVVVTTPRGTLTSNISFRVIPK